MKTKIALFLLILSSGLYANEITITKTSTFTNLGDVYGMTYDPTFTPLYSALASNGFSAGKMTASTITRGFTHFNLSEIPSNATITDSKLHLVAASKTTASIFVNQVTNGWQTDFVTSTGWSSLNNTLIKKCDVSSSQTIDIINEVLNSYINSRKGNKIGFGIVNVDESNIDKFVTLSLGSANLYLSVTYNYSVKTPDIPSSLTFTNISPTGCTLSWIETSGAAKGYKIFQNALCIGTTAGKSYNVTGLTAASNTTFTVKAYNDYAETPESLGAFCLTTPLPPSNITSTSSSNDVTLSWTTATGQVDGYHIYKNNVLIMTLQGSTAQITGLTPNTSYTFSMSSYNVSGESSRTSINISTFPELSAPTDFKIRLIDYCVPSVYYAQWTPSTSVITGYKIYRISPAPMLLIGTTTSTSWTIGPKSAFLPNTAYIYCVAAYLDGCCESRSNGDGFGFASYMKHSILSNNSVDIKKEFNLYPNPVITKLYIDGISKTFDIDVTNLQGQIIKSETKLSEYIDLSELKSGIYIIKIKYDGNEIIRRMIKQ